MSVRTAALFLLSLSLVPSIAAGQCEVAADQTLLPIDHAFEDFFGHSVDIDGDLAVVGKYGDDAVNGSAGALYAFRYDSSVDLWREEQKLVEPTGVFGANLGYAVACSGNFIVGGAKTDWSLGFPGAGSVTVYELVLGTWTGTRIENPNPLMGDHFGWSVDLDGSVLVVGAPEDSNGAGLGTGAAYVYRHNGANWVLEGILNPSDGLASDDFGNTVALSGDVIVVGAVKHDAGGSQAGAAYVFRRVGGIWTEEQKLMHPSPTAGDAFGNDVAVEGGVLVVGAQYDDIVAGPNAAGTALVWRHDGAAWVFETQLTGPAPSGADYFGAGVAITGNRIAVGAPGDDTGGTLHSFTYNGASWVTVSSFQGPVQSWTGVDVAMSGARILTGAYHFNQPGSNAGAAYVHTIAPYLLDVEETITPGQTLHFQVCGGTPGLPVALYLTSINGNPLALLLGIGVYDADGEWTFDLPLGPGTPPVQVGFTAGGLNGFGTIDVSSEALVQIL